MALEILKANIPLFEGFVEHRIALDDAEEVSATSEVYADYAYVLMRRQYYRLFEQNKVAKTIFVIKE
jgi:hypothetical protein